MKNTELAAPRVEPSEEELVLHAQRGDGAAFETLYERNKNRVFHVSLRIVRNSAEAEDLTQQVFLQLFRTIGSFRSEAKVSTWLYRVAVNAALMHLRRKKHRESSIDGAEPTNKATVNQFERVVADRSMFSATDRIHLIRAIRQLPAGCKRLYLLHDVFGYKHNEIAELVGCSAGCSKSQLHKARKKLQAFLQGKQQSANAC